MTRRPLVARVITRMNVGGPAVQVTGLMRGLDGYDQVLIAGDLDEGEQAYVVEGGLAPDSPPTRGGVRHVPGLGRSLRPGDDVRAMTSLVRELRRLRPDIVHTHTAKAGALGRVAAIACGVPYVVHTFHGHLLHGYFGRAATQAWIGGERILASRTDALVAVGTAVRDDLVAERVGSAQKFRVIPPGIAPVPTPGRGVARDLLGVPHDADVVAVVGRLVAVKRPDRLLAVVAALAVDRPRLLVLLAGGGADDAALREQIVASRLPVRMLGWRADVENVYAAADCALLVSDNEGTPVSLIEAAWHGRPCVATAVGAVDDVVEDTVTGLLVEPDVAALVAALRLLLDDACLRARLGSAASVRARGLFGVERLVADHRTLYDELLAGPPRAHSASQSLLRSAS